MSNHRQLAAILFTDIVGYTALMQENEEKAVALIKHYNSALEKTVGPHEGKVLNYYGDGSLCIFPSAMEAVNCALEIQKELQSEPVVPLRIGLHIGEIFFEEGKALGDGVNIASRIQSLGQANTILFSKEVFDKIRNHPEFKAISLGHFDFKNVDEPIEVFALANEGFVVPKREKMEGKLKELKKKSNKQKKWLMIAGVFFVLIVLGFMLYKKSFIQSPLATEEKSIAVLPFKNLSRDTSQEYFSEGMKEEILSQLYKIGGLNVISSASTEVYKDSKKTTKEIADELGVPNLLKVSVQKEGEHLRITAQLINGKTDKYLWIDTYDREFKDVFIIQSDIAQKIAALKVKIDRDTKSRIEYVPTENTNAYNLYLQSKERDRNDYDTSWKELLEKVIRLDSSFSPAYADLASYWLSRGSYNGDLNAKQVLDRALPLLRRSIQLDSNLSLAHEYMARVNLWFEWDFKEAEREWGEFFQLNPSGSHSHWTENYCDFLEADGKSFKALDFALKSRNRDKKNIENWEALALSYIYVNHADKGVVTLDSAWLLFKDPNLFFYKACVLTYLGKYLETINNLNKYFETAPNDREIPKIQAWLAISYFHTGKPSETEKIIDGLQMKNKQSPVGSPAFHIAMIYSATGRKELALQWLEKAYTGHEVEMFWLKVEPLFRPLHNNPRFQGLLTKIGFK